MTPEQILKLIEAGYTKADIEKMEAGKDDPGKEDPGKDDPGKEDPGKDDPGKNAPDTNTETMAELLKSVQGLTETVKGLQEQNIKNAQQPPEDHKGFSDLVADFTKDM
jgi:hypothetical protein